MTRRSAAALAATIVALATVVATSAVASATSYRYWTYWTGGSSWTFANAGAARIPADGSVEGWRFEISGTVASNSPRYPPGFARICGKTPAHTGQKRVAVVIDYGTTSDAPPGQSPTGGVVVHCAQVNSSFNGYQILASMTSLRVEQGMVCGISGYPARGCAQPVAAPKPSPTPTHQPTTATAHGSPTASQGGGQTRSTSSPSVPPTASSSPLHSTQPTRAHPKPSVSTVAADATVAAAATAPSSPSGGIVTGPWALVVFGVIALAVGGATWWARHRREARR